MSADPESGAPGFVRWQMLPVGSAGLVARVLGPVSLAVHVDQAFRAPNLYDLTASSGSAGPGYQLPNPALEAETARSLEAGIQVRSRRVVADVFGYVTDLRDFITREQTSCPPELADRCGDAGAVFGAVNADAAAIRGLEAAARLELGAGLSLLGSATWTRGDARLAGGMTEPLPRAPRARQPAGARRARALPRWRRNRCAVFSTSFSVTSTASSTRAVPSWPRRRSSCSAPR